MHVALNPPPQVPPGPFGSGGLFGDVVVLQLHVVVVVGPAVVVVVGPAVVVVGQPGVVPTPDGVTQNVYVQSPSVVPQN